MFHAVKTEVCHSNGKSETAADLILIVRAGEAYSDRLLCPESVPSVAT